MAYKNDTAVKDFGGDGKVIILLHGFLANSRYWSKLQPYLSDTGYRVITIDLLGFGKAPKPKDIHYTYDDHVAHVHTQIRKLGLSTSFILIGHSMGALVAARYSRIHPQHISELILLHPPLYKDMTEAYDTLRSTNRIYRFLLDSRFRRAGWMLIKTFAYRHTGRHSAVARERSLQNVIEKAEIFDDLKVLSTKTLLLLGLKDRAGYGINLAQSTLSTSIIIASENVAHHSPLQKPQLIKDRILHFIDTSKVHML